MPMALTGAFAWSLTIFSILSGSDAFIHRGRLHQPSCQGLPACKHEMQENSWSEGVPPSLTVRGGGNNVQKVATLEELEDILQNSGDAIVCIDFTATWCSPCQQIAPAVEQLAQELTDVVFLKVDVDENEETAQKYDVSQMPTFLFLRNGEVVDQFAGANAAVLRQKLEDMLKDNRPGHETAAERAAQEAGTCAEEGTVGEADATADGAEEEVEVEEVEVKMEDVEEEGDEEGGEGKTGQQSYQDDSAP